MGKLYKIEMKKLLLKENIMGIMIIFILIGSILQINSISYPCQKIHEYSDIYNSKFSFLEGETIKNIDGKLNESGKRIDEDNKKILDIIGMYKTEKIEQQQVKEFLISKEYIDIEREILQEIKGQVEYLDSTTVEHYTNINGLTALVNTGFDFYLFMFSAIMATIIYIRDKECHMDMIIKTISSNYMLIKVKKRLLILFTTTVFLIMETIRFLFILVNEGFGNFLSPISASPAIGNSNVNISFLTLYISLILIKLLWIMIISYYYYWLAQYIDNSLYFLSACIISVVIPRLIIPARTLAFIPLFGLLEPISYFKGTLYNTDGDIIFKNYSSNEYIIILIMIITTLILISYKDMLKKNSRSVVLIILSIILTGCTFNNKSNSFKEVNYNSSFNMHFEMGESYLFDSINSTMTNLSQNYSTNLERDPFVEGNIVSGNYYDNNYYYLNTYNDGFEVRKLDLDNFYSEEIYKEEIGAKNNLFVDIIEYTSSYNLTIIDIPSTIFGYEGKIILFYNDKICVVDIASKQKKAIVENNIISSIYSIDNGKLYYLDNVYQLHRYDLNTNKDTIILDKLIKSFCVISDKIYYIDMKDEKLYINNGNKTELIIDKEINYFYIENNFCYMVFQNDSLGYCINLDNKLLNQITNYQVYSFNVLEDKIIYSFYDVESKEIKIDIKSIT